MFPPRLSHSVGLLPGCFVIADPILLAGLALTALLSALLGVLLLASFSGRFPERRRWAFAETGDGAEFLFDGDLLVDATPAARGLLRLGSGRRIGAERAHLMHYLDQHFPGASDRFISLHDDGSLLMAGKEDMLLKAESRGGLVRIPCQRLKQTVPLPTCPDFRCAIASVSSMSLRPW